MSQVQKNTSDLVVISEFTSDFTLTLLKVSNFL